MKNLNRHHSPAREIACIAVVVALLVGGQVALSAVSGVEVVTILLLTFSFTFGSRAGVLAAVAFSLLRCFIFGFYPTAIVLYLIYYPLFALAFGALGAGGIKRFSRFPLWAAIAVNILLVITAAACAVLAATTILKISRLAVVMVKTLLWVIFALCTALLVVFNVFFVLQRSGRLKSANTLAIVVVAAVAALFTICFTLLDDVITPLFMGWGLFSESSALYFYTSFVALAPQTVCAIVTVLLFFFPLTTIFAKVR